MLNIAQKRKLVRWYYKYGLTIDAMLLAILLYMVLFMLLSLSF